MSILDINKEEQMNQEAIWGLDHQMRTKPIQYHIPGDFVVPFVNRIQDWLCEHWAIGGMWHQVPYTAVVKSRETYNFVPDERILGPKLNQPTSRIAAAIFLGTVDDYKKIHSDSTTHNIKVEMQTLKMVINMPVVEIIQDQTIESLLDPLVNRDRWIITWDAPSILLLRDVTNIPFEIGFWDGEFFRWKIPVEKVYLYNSPNIDPKFLALPYVETFEEHGWVI